MNNNLVLPSFKEIFKNSWAFYKMNWKKVVFLFLPIEIAILVTFVLFDMLPKTDATIVIISAGVLSMLAFLFTSLSKIATLEAPALVGKMTLGDKTPYSLDWYTSLVKRIIPISLVLLLVLALNFGFISLVLMAGGIVFVLITFLISLVTIHESLAIVLNIAFITSLAYVVLRYSIAFLVRGTFSIYAYFFESRSGIDALVSSFLMTKGREFSIFWRSVGIWFVTSIPFLLLVVPINASIIYNSLSDLYVQVVILHQEPVFTSPSLLVTILLDMMTSISGLLGVSFFVVMNYFLWKGIKDTTTVFEEDRYIETRAYLKRIIGFGIILFVLILIASLVFAFMSF